MCLGILIDLTCMLHHISQLYTSVQLLLRYQTFTICFNRGADDYEPDGFFFPCESTELPKTRARVKQTRSKPQHKKNGKIINKSIMI